MPPLLSFRDAERQHAFSCLVLEPMTGTRAHAVTTAFAVLIGLAAGRPAAAQAGEAERGPTHVMDRQSLGPDPVTFMPRRDIGGLPAANDFARPGPAGPDPARFGTDAERRPGLASPTVLCAALSHDAGHPPKWQRSALPDESWECFDETIFTTEHGGGAIFAIFRGKAETRIDSFRLKLSLMRDGRSEGLSARAAAVTTLEQVFAALGWSLPPPLRDAIDRLLPYKGAVEGTAVEFRKEFGSVPRWNLIVDFSEVPPTVVTPLAKKAVP